MGFAIAAKTSRPSSIEVIIRAQKQEHPARTGSTAFNPWRLPFFRADWPFVASCLPAPCRDFSAAYFDFSLTAAQFVTMCAIQEHGTCSLSDIVKTTAIDQATIRGIIERLKLRELIVLSHDAADRRKVLVTLSHAGVSLVGSTVPHAADITEATFGNLNPAERVAITYLLRKMIADDGEAA